MQPKSFDTAEAVILATLAAVVLYVVSQIDATNTINAMIKDSNRRNQIVSPLPLVKPVAPDPCPDGGCPLRNRPLHYVYHALGVKVP